MNSTKTAAQYGTKASRMRRRTATRKLLGNLETLEPRQLLANDVLDAVLEPIGAPEQWIYGDQLEGQFSDAAETDSIPLLFEAGQKLTLTFNPLDGGLDSTVTVLDATSSVIASASSVAGEAIVLSDIDIADAGVYTVELTNTAGVGEYEVALYLNATAETEPNDSISSATDISSGMGTLPFGGTRQAAVGAFTDSDPFDYFAFELDGGSVSSVMLSSGSPLPITLLNDSGEELLAGSITPEGLSSISGFAPADAGTYYIRVSNEAASTQQYQLVVVQGSDLSLEPNDRREQSQELGAAQRVVGAIASSGGAASGTIRVAVHGTVAEYADNVVAQLLDSTVFDFDAIVVNSAEIDTEVELREFDVVVVGEPFVNLSVAAAQAIRDWSAAKQGGVVGTGWLMCNVTNCSASPASRATIDEIVPLNLSGSRITNGSLLTITDSTHPITEGLSSVSIGGQPHDLSSLNADAGATVLGTVGSNAAVIVADEEIRRSVYLSIPYFYFYSTGTGAPDQLLEQAVAWAAGAADEDHYVFSASEGDNLVISTATPGSASGAPENDLDPILELYYESGSSPEVIVAASDNTGDGDQNSLISYAVPSGASGTYRIVVRGVSGSGAYELDVAGATATTAADFVVIDSLPADGAEQFSVSTFRVQFNQPVLLSSLDAGDLTINGQPADGLTLIDGRTIEFDIASLTVSDGVYTASIAAGALVGASGEPLQEFSSTFTVDTTSPTIANANLSDGDIVTDANPFFSFEFSEGLESSVLSEDDFELYELFSGMFFSPLFELDNNVLNLEYSDLPQGSYELRLRSGSEALRDRVGNLFDGGAGPGSDALFTFSVDLASTFSALSPVAPLGSRIFEGSLEGAIHDGSDSDTFSIDVVGDQALSVLITAIDPDLQIAASLSTGETAQADFPGGPALIQTAYVASDTTFVLTIDTLSGTGRYLVQVVLNAQIEEETIFGGSNDEAGLAQDLTSTAIFHPPLADRMAVVGRFDDQGIVDGPLEPNDTLDSAVVTCFVGNGCSFDSYRGVIGDNSAFEEAAGLDVDLYQLELFAFQEITVETDAQAIGSPLNTYIRIFDADGVELTSNDDDGETLDSFLFFTPEEDGIYYVGVSSSINSSYDPTVSGSGQSSESASETGFYDLYISLNIAESSSDSGNSQGQDVYTVFLNPGEFNTFVVTSTLGGGEITLCDENGNQIAAGIGDLNGMEFANVDQAIIDYVSTTGGQYFIHVRGSSFDDYSLVVTRGSTFDLEDNSDAAVPQSVGDSGHVLGSVGPHLAGDPGAVGSTTLTRTLTDGAGYAWQITGNGSIQDGTSNVFDAAFTLSGFGFFSSAQTEQNGREVVIGPAFFNSQGVLSTRNIFVSEDAGLIRYLDTFTNPLAQPVTIQAFYFANVNGLQVRGTSSGDLTASSDDYWLTIEDGSGSGRPGSVFVFGSPDSELLQLSTDSSENINWSYELTLQPGETASLMMFGAQEADDSLLNGIADSMAQLSASGLLDGLTGAQLDSVANFDLESSDEYYFDVIDPTTLTISTSTPGSGVGEPNNMLDPALALFYVDGPTPEVPVAVSMNEGNEFLVFDVLEWNTGRYRVSIVGDGSRGTFSLGVESSVAGAVSDTTPFVVLSVFPGDASDLSQFPEYIELEFSEQLLLTSVSPSDFVVTGPSAVNISEIIVVDGRRLEIVVDSTGALDGEYQISIDSGALSSLAGDLIEPITFSYFLDATPPTVVSSTIEAGDVLPTGNVSFSAVFSEPLMNVLGASSVLLLNLTTGVQVPAVSGAYDPATLTYSANFANLPDGQYRLLLPAVTFQDLVGNQLDGNADGTGGDSFFIDFATDEDKAINEVRAVQPLGSMIYSQDVFAVAAGTGDVDDIAIQLDANQVVSLLLNAPSTLQARLELVAPDGTTLGTADATGVGGPVWLQGIPIVTEGNYQIRVTSLAGSGAYGIEVLLNASLELESVAGTDNGSTATSQSIDASEITVVGTASRLGLVGTVGNLTSADVLDIGRDNRIGQARSMVYAGSGEFFVGNGDLWSLSSTGVSTFRGFMNHTPNGMAFVDGGLYSGDAFGSSLFLVDPNDGSSLDSIDIELDGEFINGFNGLATDPTTGTLYAIVRPAGASSSVRFLVTIDLMTGVATSIGEMGDNFSGIAFDNGGQLLSVTGSGGSNPNRFFLIDKTDASSQIVAQLPGESGGQALAYHVDEQRLYRASGSFTFQSIGVTETVDEADVYQFDLQAGEFVSVGATGGAGVRIELLSPTGQLLSIGSPSGVNFSDVIQDFLVPADGSYYLRVSAVQARTEYSLLVTKGIGLELEPNDDISDAEFLGPTQSVLGSTGAGAIGSDGTTGTTSLSVNLFDSAGFRWDITGSGSISDGSSDAFDGGFVLSGFQNFSSALTEQNGREIVIGPGAVSGLSTTRKIFVPTDRSFARFLDIFTNNTTSTITTTIRYDTNLGSDGSETNLATSSGDTILDSQDTWLVTDDSSVAGGDPAVAHIVAGPGLPPTSFLRPSGFVRWSYDISVAPGQSVSLMNFSVQNFDRTTAISTTQELGTGPSYALVGLSNSEISSIQNWQLSGSDQFLIEAAPEADLIISTTTPSDGAGLFYNDLDPLIELYYQDGADPEVLVASNDNGAGDGRNATLEYSVPVDAGGTYRILIRGVESSGEYTLNVAGATVVNAFEATAVEPLDGELLSQFPDVYRVTFNQSILLSSVDASDLRINGVAASGVTIIDGKTLEFDVAGLFGTDGEYTVTITPGALTSVGGGTNAFFTATFNADSTSPTVIATSIDEGEVVSPDGLVFQATFSESLETAGLDGDDIQVIDASSGNEIVVESFSYDDSTRTITVTFQELPEGAYTLTLLSSDQAFRDRRGNLLDGNSDGTAGDDFVLNFNVDFGTSLLPVPVSPVAPDGSLVYETSAAGSISPAGDLDSFAVEVEAGQLLTLIVQPTDGSLRPTVELRGPGGNSSSNTAAAAGGIAAIQVFSVSTPGLHTIDVAGADGTVGGYTLRVLLNSLVEDESLGGVSNDSTASAESLDTSSVALIGNADRLSVFGASDGEDDFYRFELSAGQTATIFVAPLVGAMDEVELLDAAGVSLTSGILSEAGETTIRGFVAPTTGEYLVRVRGVGSQYSMVLSRDADFDFEPNDDLASPQKLLGALPVLGGLQFSTAGSLIDFSDVLGNLSLEGFSATGLWHVTTACGGDLPGHSAPNIAYFGIDSACNFNAGRVAGTLTSPSLSLRPGTSPELSLKYRFDGEGGSFDRTEVRVSTDGGATFTTVANKSNFPTALTWTDRTIDLSAYAGQTIVLQFWFDSIDGVANTGLGWQLDDLFLTGVTDVFDHHSFRANEGDVLTLRTLTPGDQAGQPANEMDPVIQLFTAGGLLLASDDDSSLDGRNAELVYTVPAGVGNEFVIRVSTSNGLAGAYILSVDGSSADNLNLPTVESVSPGDGQAVANAPTALVVTFSEAILATSLQASDLVFDDASVEVTGVQFIDGRTVAFLLNIPDAMGDYTYTLTADSVLDLQGLSNPTFSGLFQVDRTGPRVTSTSPQSQASAPFNSLTFVFDEFIDPDSVSIGEDIISFTGPSGANLLSSISSISINGNELTVGFSNQTAAGSYSMRIGPNILDLVGNVMDQNENGTGGESNDSFLATIVLQSPDLTVSSVATTSAALFGSTIEVSYTVANIGTDPANEGWVDALYLSTNTVLDRDDILLRRIPNAGLLGPLDAAGGENDSYTRNELVTLPLSIGSLSGNYFIIAATDDLRRQPESLETNNNRASAIVQIDLPPLPDLIVTDVSLPSAAFSGQEVQVRWTLANQGTAPFTGSIVDQLYLSIDQTFGNDLFVGNFPFTGTIPAGGSVERVQTITLPVTLEGTRYVIVRTDSTNTVFEHDGESNNVTVDDRAMEVTLSPFPNLQVTSIVAPETAFSSQSTLVEWVVTNSGDGATSAPIWFDAVYLSTDTVFDNSDIYLGNKANLTYLNPGESYQNSLAVTLPQGISGDRYFIVVSDQFNQVFEYIREDDNSRVADRTSVQLTPPPDLQVTQVLPPAGFSGQTVTINWTVRNEGPGLTLQSSWWDQVYLSTDETFDGSDVYLGQRFRSGTLLPDQEYNGSLSATLPIGIQGTYYYIVRTDAFNQVFEHIFEQNNETTSPAGTISLTPPPDLQVLSVDAPDVAIAGRLMTVVYEVANFGATETPNSQWRDSLYFSTDANFDPAVDTLIADRIRYGSLDAFDTYQGSFSFAPGFNFVGEFYAFVVTDRNNQVFEVSDTNNFAGDIEPVAITITPPDLVVASVTAPSEGQAGQSIAVSFTVENVGVGDTIVGSWRDRVWLSTDQTLGNADDVLLRDIIRNGILQPGTSYTVTGQVVPLAISLAAGDYYLYVQTDGLNQVNESTAEGNNSFGPLPISITRQTADLQVTSLEASPQALNSEDNLTVNWQVTNAGSVPTETNFWFDSVYLSVDPVLGFGEDILLGTFQRTNVLQPGDSYEVTRSIKLPFELSGQYYVIVQTDSTSRVFEEGVEGNNVSATVAPLDITLRPVPDLELTIVDAPNSAFSGQTMTFNWTVENSGNASATGSWYDAVYLSLDQILDRTSDTYLGFRNRPNHLSVGEVYNQSFNFNIPQGLSGPFYVFVVADGGNNIFERGAETNNSSYDTTPVNVQLLPPADLVVGNIVIPASGVPGQNATITYTVSNNGTNAARGAWNDTLYISTDNQWDLSDQLFGTVNHVGDVAGGSSYSESLTAPLPGVLPGEYFVIVRSDIRNRIPESNEANNIGASLDLFDLDVEELVLGTTTSTSLTTGRSVYYKLDLVAGETVRISVDSQTDNGFNDLFVRFGQFPTRGQFDLTADPPFQTDPSVILPVEQTGTYYVQLFGNQVSGAQTVDVLAEVIPFSLFSAASDVIGNIGDATLEVRGARFTQDTQFELFADIGGVGVSLPAEEVLLQDSTRAFPTFELLALPTGLYSLRAVDGESTVVLADAITVQGSIGDDVVVLIDGPDVVRPDRVIPIGLQYGNLGDQDAGAPLLVVTSASNTPIGFTQDTMASGPLFVFGASPNGPLDVLRPGSTGSASVLYNSGGAVDVVIEPYTPADTELISETQWLEIEAAIRPASLTNAQWNPYWADIQPRIGSTWGDYVGFLNRLVKVLTVPGQPLHDVRAMFERAFNEFPDFRPGRTFTGQLVTDLGAPVVGAEVALYDSEGRMASRTNTDTTGQYVLSFRESGAYTLAVEAPFTWDVDSDGAVDLDSPAFDLENAADVVQGPLVVERTLLNTIEQASPVLMTDAAGMAHLLFTREGKLWHAYHDGTGWVDGQVITEEAAYQFNLVADAQLIDGTEAGLVATWFAGLDNEAELYYAVGRPEADGTFTWSEPIQQSNNSIQELEPVSVVVDGQVLTVYLRRDRSIQDDADLYYDLMDIESSSLTFPTYLVAIPAGDLLPQAQTAKSAQFGWEHSFGPWNFLGAELDAKAEFNGQIQVQCAPGCSLDAQAGGGFGGSITLPNGNKIEGSGTGAIKGSWKADSAGTAWDFQGASLDAGGSLSFSWDGGLTTVLGYMGPQGRAASTFIRGAIDFAEYWVPTIQVSEGIRFTGGLAFEGLKWSSSPPFPNFLMPESVSAAKVSGSVGPYVSVQDFGGTVDVSVQGNVGVTVQVYPSFKIGPITGTIQAGAVVNGWQIGPASFSISVLNSLGGDGVFPADQDLPFSFNPLAALGSTAVYGSNSVLSGVASDLAAESSPTLAQRGAETFLAWIADGDLGASTPEVGNRVKVADFNGSGFNAPVSIPDSIGFNRHLETAFDANGNRVAVWSMASVAGLGSDTTAEELKAAMRSTDIVFSVFDGSSWSSPLVTEATPGTDAAVSIAETAEGDLLLTWSTFDETNGYRLMAQRWNQSTLSFGAAEVLVTGAEINEVEVGIVGGKTTVFWTEDVDADPEAYLRNIFFTTFDGGVWETATEFAPAIAPAGLSSSGSLYSENLIASLPDLPTAMASMAESLRGDVVAAWASGDQVNEETTIGSVQVALYRNGAWAPTVSIPGSTGVIREVTAATNANGELFVLWLAQRPDGGSDLLVSLHSRDGWSEPSLVAKGTGLISQLRIGMDGLSGELIATWVDAAQAGGKRLLTSTWRDGWTTADVLDTGDAISNDAIRLHEGNAVATWTVDGRVMSSRLQNSSWTTADLATQAQLAAGALALHDMFLLPSIVSSMQTAGLYRFAGSFRLLPVPEDCKKCDRVEEIRRGSGDCGYRVEFDEENCKRITYYRPCVIRPIDPNDILGPEGFGEANWISADDKFNYTIRFENQPSATAPAQEVVITQVLDPDLNPAKFRLGEFGFRNLVFDAPNKPFSFQSIDLTEELGVIVNMTALIDIASGTATWTFRTIDPATGLPPLDATLGFLPVNDETGIGEGFVSYVIEADVGVPTGTVIDAEARIVFDTEEPIDTPPIFNTLDAEAPESLMSVVTSEESTEFTLSWTGADPNEGSGIALYDIFVSTNGDGYIKWLANTELTEAVFVGEPGNTYEFYSSAVDNATNVEAEPEVADVIVITPGELASIGDRVWNDLDFNGIQDAEEPGVEGVTVTLFIDDGGEGQVVTSTTTDTEGNYVFTDLAVDASYFVQFSDLPAGFAFTDSNLGGDDEIDSDVDVVTGLTEIFTVVGGENFSWDAGLVALGSISGSVWNDLNGDGTRQSEEAGLVGWTVYLDLNDDGAFTAGEPAVLSNEIGEYSFGDLRPGVYVVSEVIEEGWMQTSPGEAGASSAGLSRSTSYVYTGKNRQLTSPGLEVAARGATPASNLIGLDEFRADPKYSATRGAGYSVVIIDTGIDLDHRFFGGDANGDGISDRIVYQYDFADRDNDASDYAGHGSHVSSIIASGDSQYPGIAPDANIIHLKVFSDSGQGYFSYVEQALDWVIKNVDTYNIAAVNLSIGDGLNWANARGVHGLGDELAALAQRNVIAVAAAGNAYGLYRSEGVSYPAADPNTISVGAVWDSNRGGPWTFGSYGTDYLTDADHITSFSQRSDRVLDVFAPGAVITAANARGGVTSMRGTSMATPFVTGAAVLAQQLANQHLGRSLSTVEFRYLLSQSGVVVVDGDNEQDSVPNTMDSYLRLDLKGLADAVVNFDGKIGDSNGSENGGGSNNPIGPADGRPFSYTIDLAPGQQRTGVDFGNMLIDSVGPEIVSITEVSPDPRRTPVAFVDVTFSEEIELSSFDFHDLTLRRGAITLPLDARVTTELVSGTTYRIGGLNFFTSVQGPYTLVVSSVGIEDLSGNVGLNSLEESWTVDTRRPTSRVGALATVQSSTTFTVSVSGADPVSGGVASGVASYEIYRSVDGSPWQLWTTVPASAPSATYEAESSQTIGFYSIAIDAAGNREAKTPRVEAGTFVPDLLAPSTSVTSVETSTSTFVVEFSGADVGGSTLSNFQLYVAVDGGVPTLIATVSAGTPDATGVYQRSASFNAIADGALHEYRFFTLGTDSAGNVESAPDAPQDVTVSALFEAPDELYIRSFDVQQGAIQRSFVRYVDVTFSLPDPLLAMVSTIGDGDLTNDRIQLIRHELDGTGGVPVSLEGVVSVNNAQLNFDFGSQGIGGNRNSPVGDGYYMLQFDLNADGDFVDANEEVYFYRLLGNVNADRAVTQDDLVAITNALGSTGSNLEEDANGDGIVNQIDRIVTTQALGRSLGAGLDLTPPSPLTVTNFDVQKGMDQRSFVRFADVSFSHADLLVDLVASLNDSDVTNDRVILERFALDGSGAGVAVDLSGSAVAIDQVMAFDFGAQGLGGSRNSADGNGYYRLKIDLDGDGDFDGFDQELTFYRLLGDVDGDREVTAQDLNFVQQNLGMVGENLEPDANGDGVVNNVDRVIAARERGKRLGADLPLSD